MVAGGTCGQAEESQCSPTGIERSQLSVSDIPPARFDFTGIAFHSSLVHRMTTIYHNPRCTKSRQALQLLEEHGIEPEVIQYLDTPPSKKKLIEIVKLLGIPAEALVRKKEPLFKELNLGEQTLTDQQWIATMVEHPKLIERPIVIHNGQAAIGRPTENIVEILDA
ncbi:Arsenate reductase [Rhodopirellula islandica]|uniref:Arsenate reductase n=2 Tax=Rhodopirellula islandica TaxID=595434 RepID=A0A0J1BLX2_RHOIS|nr:Arsenate reductase [Rhodopirellula islandica]